jgi:hypothetical protein
LQLERCHQGTAKPAIKDSPIQRGSGMKDIYQQVGEWLTEVQIDSYLERNDEDLLNRAHELLNTLYETYWEDQKNQ